MGRTRSEPRLCSALDNSPIQTVRLTCLELSSSGRRRRTNFFKRVNGTSRADRVSVERSRTRSKRRLDGSPAVLSSFQPCTTKFGAPSYRDFRTWFISGSPMSRSSCSPFMADRIHLAGRSGCDHAVSTISPRRRRTAVNPRGLQKTMEKMQVVEELNLMTRSRVPSPS